VGEADLRDSSLTCTHNPGVDDNGRLGERAFRLVRKLGQCGRQRSDEAVAAARYGNLSALPLVQCLHERRSLDLEVVLRGDLPRPDPRQQLIPAPASTARTSRARLPRTGIPSRDSSRRARSNRNRPNVTSSPLIARNQSWPRIQNISVPEPKTLSSSLITVQHRCRCVSASPAVRTLPRRSDKTRQVIFERSRSLR
jgi:hypothetical protein